MLKQTAICNIIHFSDTLNLKRLRNPAILYTDSLPNNAYFMNFKRYQSKQEDFTTDWLHRFGGNLRAYIAYLKKNIPHPDIS